MKNAVILHMFVPGSGEYALHGFLQRNKALLPRLGLSYSGSAFDKLYGTMSHRTLQEYIVGADAASSEEARKYWRRTAAESLRAVFSETEQAASPILSLRLPRHSGMDLLLKACKNLPGLQGRVIRPLFSLTHQADFLEFQTRFQLWHCTPDTLFDACFVRLLHQNYLQFIDSFQRLAQKHGIETLPPSVLWHNGEPGAAGMNYLERFFSACGSDLPENLRVTLPYTGLRAYDTLRFAALVLPQRPALFFRLLDVAPLFSQTACPQAALPGLMSALRRAEDDRAVTAAPLTSRELRRKVTELSREGNAALALAYPELAAAVRQAPWCDDTAAGVEPHPLREESADALLDYFTPAQRDLLRRGLKTAEPLLVPEQAMILQRLQKRAAPGGAAPSQALLSVLTLARDHSKYIAECMEGVLAQQTDFPVEHIIVDDGSSDGTQDIIDDYACRHAGIRPVYLKEKLYDGDNVRLLFLLARTPFVALCDGDDYFSAPHKLQRQVDFLRAHPDYALCFHPVRVLYEDDPFADGVFPTPDLLPRGVRQTYYLADLLRGNLIQTNSVVYRWRFRDGLPDWFNPGLVPGDYYWHLLHAETGKIGFLREIMSVYRRHKKSLYYSVLKSLVEHRRIHGMKELEMYDAVNTHFNGRYLRLLQNLANGVFTDFFNLYLKGHESSFLDEACARFPAFGKPFLETVARSLKEGGGTIKIARRAK